ncbi:nucleoside-diphosphate-sugar epimerase [Trabulsiella guamensis ATCC 49490]|uniref:Nucleoside-diphosphate-sugar epimerase n=1 Tax=Trabulsiella guamensis ATCC 49490 TaxID=1005994 RepID=A0A085AFK0_9ENTR|nr:SDR family oxidoreductase [Trabulsiella guamensis]KFC08995.1 nucleoside-diphosphate-sugar epimerase [Trabulsiella guamensis ATCC 49490]
MRVFLTGATGFIGSHLIPELRSAGHQVIGLARSDASASALTQAGVEVHRGSLEEPDSLLAGVAQADAVIHTAFDHDFSRFVENCQKDSRVIAALGSALKGSSRPLIITSGTGMGDPGHGELAVETVFNPAHPNPRIASELAGNALLEEGVDVRVMRLPQVHDTRRQGLISYYISLSREKGSAAYIGEGANCWSAAHVTDVAQLYRLALEQGARGERYHAVAEQAVTSRIIADVVGAGVGIPVVSLTAEESQAYFGWFSAFASLDLRASGDWTQQRLGWRPVGPSLVDDLRAMDYSA